MSDAASASDIAALKEKAASGEDSAVSNGAGRHPAAMNGGENGQNAHHVDMDDEDEDDEEMGEEEEEEEESAANMYGEEVVEEIDDDDEMVSGENSMIESDGYSKSGPATREGSVNGDAELNEAGRSHSKRKTPIKVREIEEIDSDEDDDDSNDVEEVQDEEDEEAGSPDSDIVEVEPEEDPLKRGGGEKSKPSASSTSGPNVVTIDDVKTLHMLANSAKKNEPEKQSSVVMIDTNAILAGKATSGVTITPAKPKTPVTNTAAAATTAAAAAAAIAAAGQKIPSGVTISQSTKSSSAAGSSSSTSTAFGYDSKGQLNDPNLTDDTFVVEAPSFIVPYVYEKPPKEKFEDFSKSVRDIMEKMEKEERAKRKKEREERRQKRKEEKAKKGQRKKKEEDQDDGAVEDEDDDDFEADEDKDSGTDASVDSDDSKDDDVVAVFDESIYARKRETKENYFESSLSKFIVDLGMSLVEESVQSDLLKMQVKRSQKDKSAPVMHAIRSLKANLEKSREHNQPFKMQVRKCQFCSFRTESELVMQQHLETPHMKAMMYRCNFCPYETRLPQEVLAHMQTEHAVRGRLERAPGLHQCPQCPFEDSMKGKLTRHMKGCEKRYVPARNQMPPHDWEPPAKVPKPPPLMAHQRRPGHMMPPGSSHHQAAMAAFSGNHFASGAAGRMNPLQHQMAGKGMFTGMPQLQFGPGRGRGRPGMPFHQQDGMKLPSSISMTRQGPGMSAFNKNMMGANYSQQAAAAAAAFQAYNQKKTTQLQSSSILSNLSSNSSVTIQSVGNRGGASAGRHSTKPSISITAMPGGGGGSGRLQQQQHGGFHKKQQQSMGGGMRAGQPSGSMGAAAAMAAGGTGGKGGFVICEICDGYIKDLEQLRKHMLWYHKVKIHPKMIHSRPPLNCQKCQFRFFTDQGLERHLLGSHGLVTASMQDLANKGRDSGRCPVCGKRFDWKLLNHVAQDHQKTLKPAHLSYKCTVCTATFGQYKLFENHVYQAHSGAAKKDRAKQQQQQHQAVKAAAAAAAASKAPVKMSKDITIIPRPATAGAAAGLQKVPTHAVKKAKAAGHPDVIDIDDEEEIDDVEEDQRRSGGKRPGSHPGEFPPEKRLRPAIPAEESCEDGVQEIQDDDGEDFE